ncbi:MAG: polysaccharide biosynthesis protein, partial [Arenibacter sp.]
TVEAMTRFNISLQGGVDMVLHAMKAAWGGEIFIPKIPSYKITDVAQPIGPNCEHKIIGIRPGEKIHEEMITSSDSFFTYNLGKYFVIVPQTPMWNINDFISKFNAELVPDGFAYNSGTNTEWETVESLRSLLTEQEDSNFIA